VERTKLHRLPDILVITLCAVICGADTWMEIELFGQAKLDWLRTFLQLPHGIPLHGTFGRVFARLNPEQLERCFLTWMQALAQASGGRLIAIDGKTLRRRRPSLTNSGWQADSVSATGFWARRAPNPAANMEPPGSEQEGRASASDRDDDRITQLVVVG